MTAHIRTLGTTRAIQERWTGARLVAVSVQDSLPTSKMGAMTMFREYGIFDNLGNPIFSVYRSLNAAMDVVANCFDTSVVPSHHYRDLFPVTIEGLDRDDTYTTITTITYESR